MKVAFFVVESGSLCAVDFTVSDFMVRLILKSRSITNSPTMAEQERVMDRSSLSIMLQFGPGALAETSIDRDSSGQYLPTICQIGA